MHARVLFIPSHTQGPPGKNQPQMPLLPAFQAGRFPDSLEERVSCAWVSGPTRSDTGHRLRGRHGRSQTRADFWAFHSPLFPKLKIRQMEMI